MTLSFNYVAVKFHNINQIIQLSMVNIGFFPLLLLTKRFIQD